MNLTRAWIADLRRALGKGELLVRDVRIGVFYTAAQLSSGHVGVAFTPRGVSDQVCCPASAASAPPSGRLNGQDAWSLAEYALAEAPLRRAVGVCVLNALSALAMERRGIPGGELRDDCDALEAAEVNPEDRVVMVGAFIPFIKKLRGHVEGLWVIDKHPEALRPEELQHWRPPGEARATVAHASVVIVSGSALVETGLDGLLDAAGGARRVILAGPTASCWPPPFFERGVDVLGGIRITDGPAVMAIAGQAGSGYFFNKAARKVCILRTAHL